MDFLVEYLSFFVIQTEGNETSAKTYKHFQTLDQDDFAESEIKRFLDGEFARITKRKAERHPAIEQAPTKVGRFLVEPGHDLTSNPNYNMFYRLQTAENKQQYLDYADGLVRAYIDTSAARGGALIVVRTKLPKYFDTPLIFVMKCDFEQKIARITDEESLLHQVDMAINAKNMKSIQYPYMPEVGILEEWELKIHQSSHARYFEDFLKFVTYEKSLPELISHQVMDMVQEYVEQKWPEPENEVRQAEERDIELWAASDERDIQHKWQHEQVQEAAVRMIEEKPELELKFKLDGTFVKGLLADYGNRIHIAQLDDRYIVLIEGGSFSFEKGFSPVELLQPLDLEDVIQYLKEKREESD